MNTIDYIKDLHSANYWATETLLNLIPKDIYYAETKGSFNSIDSVFNHLWDAQQVWYNRLTGDANAPLPSKSFVGTHSEKIAAILKSYQNYIDLLADKTDDYLSQQLSYTNLKGIAFNQPQYQILFQLTHHSASHRGQVLLLMRQLGFEGIIPQTDVVAWYRLFK